MIPIDSNDVAPLIMMVMAIFAVIVIVLVKHQQRMAMIVRNMDPDRVNEDTRMHNNRISDAVASVIESKAGSPNIDKRLDAIETQVAELKALAHQQTIILDTLARNQQASNAGVQQRLND